MKEGRVLLKTVIVGIGGAGINLLDEWILTEEKRGLFYALDSDYCCVEGSLADYRVLLGKTRAKGEGSKGDVDFAKVILEDEAELIEQILDNCDHLLVLCGLGGGMGSAGLSFFSKKAQQKKVIMSCIGFLPFISETLLRQKITRDTLQSLQETDLRLILFSNDRAQNVFGPEDDRRRLYRNFNKKVGSAISCWYNLVQETKQDSFDRESFPDFLYIEDFYTFSLHTEDLFSSIQPFIQSAQDPALDQKTAWACFFLPPSGKQVDKADMKIRGKNLFKQFYVSLVEGEEKSKETGFVAVGSSRLSGYFREETEENLDHFENIQKENARSFEGVDEKKIQEEELPAGIFEKSYKTIHKGENLDLPTFLRKGISIKI
ncbi:hypothetical protein [Candidatus Methylacidiphilum infernorum]|nr:hypothetical protein [Candidatus Methylacidiphilum infernorum]